MVAYVNDNWDRKPLHLCSYLMWRCNWIHPFFDGNGRTTRALAYLVFVARLGYEPGGTPTFVDMIAADKWPYYDALDAADAAYAAGMLDVSAMENLVAGLLARQLMGIVRDAQG
jgi:fido (protein-threonine AMPylation protein)